MSRGTSRTTQQLHAAPTNALFVWADNNLDYPNRLAEKLNRLDIEIVGPSILEYGAKRLLGRTLSAIVLDHALWLTNDQMKGLEIARTRIAPTVSEGK